MREVLPLIPSSTSVGLRVYGHRTGFTPRQSCSASQLISPIVPNNSANIYSRLSSLSAVGMTPITYSLKQAAYYDMSDTSSKNRIILISDGGENCDESPCDFIIELQKHRDDIRIDVIALAIGDYDANNQLKCVALVTSGKFYNANTAAELKNSLEDSLNLQKEVQGVIINH
jgi:Ca-activated chloride channel family protein